MQIYGVNNVHGPHSLSAPHRTAAAPASPGTAFDTADEVSFSPEAQFASQLRNIPEIRADRVAQLREAIASGSYETDAKLNVALDRLLDEIG